ncbi:hypothetical protein [Neobacillus soli]|nr:hypothetical protein [Neobacillus soli]
MEEDDFMPKSNGLKAKFVDFLLEPINQLIYAVRNNRPAEPKFM